LATVEYAIAIPPLNRTILDLVFNVVFIFDDFDDRLCWYFQSGLEEVERKLARFKRKYSGEPAWTTWFQKTATVGNPFAEGRDKVCAGKSRVTKRFPHPGQVLSKKVRFKEGKSLDFLIHLNDWFYRDLSSSSHGHWGGLTERAAQILRMETKDETQRRIAQKFKSDCMLQQTTLRESSANTGRRPKKCM